MPPEVFFGLLFTLVAATWLLTPITRALAERLKGGARSGADLLAMREELRAVREEVLGDQEAVRRDLAELAERVDFAERLLARQREPERLGPPAPGS